MSARARCFATRVLLVLMGMVLVVNLCGCGAQGKGGSSGQLPDEIVVGVLAPLTGWGAVVGKAIQQGIDWAVEDINNAGGVKGSKIRVVYRDFEVWDPTKTANGLQELLTKEQVHAIIGSFSAASGNAAHAILSENPVPAIMFGYYTDLIDATKYPYAFRIMMYNRQLLEALFTYAAKADANRIALVRNNSADGADVSKYSTSAIQRVGKTLVADIAFTTGDPDMTGVAQQVKAAKPEAVILWASGADGARIVTAMQRVGYAPPNDCIVLGSPDLFLKNFYELAGEEACMGTFSLAEKRWTFRMDGSYDPEAEEFKLEARERYGTKRDTYASTIALFYDGLSVLAQAIEKAGSVEYEDVKAALESGTEFRGTWLSSYSFSPTEHDARPGAQFVLCPVFGEPVDGEFGYGVETIEEARELVQMYLQQRQEREQEQSGGE